MPPKGFMEVLQSETHIYIFLKYYYYYPYFTTVDNILLNLTNAEVCSTNKELQRVQCLNRLVKT